MMSYCCSHMVFVDLCAALISSPAYVSPGTFFCYINHFHLHDSHAYLCGISITTGETCDPNLQAISNDLRVSYVNTFYRWLCLPWWIMAPSLTS